MFVSFAAARYHFHRCSRTERALLQSTLPVAAILFPEIKCSTLCCYACFAVSRRRRRRCVAVVLLLVHRRLDVVVTTCSPCGVGCCVVRSSPLFCSWMLLLFVRPRRWCCCCCCVMFVLLPTHLQCTANRVSRECSVHHASTPCRCVLDL